MNMKLTGQPQSPKFVHFVGFYVFSWAQQAAPLQKIMCGRGAACCALQWGDIKSLLGSLDYDFTVALMELEV
jgi:hypothetical protein